MWEGGSQQPEGQGGCEPLVVPSVEEPDESRLGFRLGLQMELVPCVLKGRKDFRKST